MIQDADLEYDLDDYEGLLAPVIAWQSMFVLGSRHLFGWKMRKFTDAQFMAVILNLGHQFFRTLVNVALNAQMTDPFTMYKVFRRDALFGIELRSEPLRPRYRAGDEAGPEGLFAARDSRQLCLAFVRRRQEGEFYEGRADLGRHDSPVPAEGDRSGPNLLAIGERG